MILNTSKEAFSNFFNGTNLDSRIEEIDVIIRYRVFERQNMFEFFRKKRIKKYIGGASAYILTNYMPPAHPSGIRYSLSENPEIKSQKKETELSDTGIRYSDRNTGVSYGEHDTTPLSDSGIQYSRKKAKTEDPYNATEVSRILQNCLNSGDLSVMLQSLEKNVNQTFVDRLIYYINKKGVRNSEIYKTAQVDKRLFSKIMSNRQYKPSKDTVIAIAFALELSLDEVKDMLSRTGYTLSHSNKRDIIIEYFFREKVYSLIDINDVLYRLGQKPIGRL